MRRSAQLGLMSAGYVLSMARHAYRRRPEERSPRTGSRPWTGHPGESWRRDAAAGAAATFAGQALRCNAVSGNAHNTQLIAERITHTSMRAPKPDMTAALVSTPFSAKAGWTQEHKPCMACNVPLRHRLSSGAHVGHHQGRHRPRGMGVPGHHRPALRRGCRRLLLLLLLVAHVQGVGQGVPGWQLRHTKPGGDQHARGRSSCCCSWAAVGILITGCVCGSVK